MGVTESSRTLNETWNCFTAYEITQLVHKLFIKQTFQTINVSSFSSVWTWIYTFSIFGFWTIVWTNPAVEDVTLGSENTIFFDIIDNWRQPELESHGEMDSLSGSPEPGFKNLHPTL